MATINEKGRLLPRAAPFSGVGIGARAGSDLVKMVSNMKNLFRLFRDLIAPRARKMADSDEITRAYQRYADTRYKETREKEADKAAKYRKANT